MSAASGPAARLASFLVALAGCAEPARLPNLPDREVACSADLGCPYEGYTCDPCAAVCVRARGGELRSGEGCDRVPGTADSAPATTDSAPAATDSAQSADDTAERGPGPWPGDVSGDDSGAGATPDTVAAIDVPPLLGDAGEEDVDAGEVAPSCIPETCNMMDDDCDGVTDEGFGYQGLRPGEPCDGVGACGVGVVVCDPDGGPSICSTNPDGPSPDTSIEVCDGLDNDCDGDTDEDLCSDGDPCTTDACAGRSGSCTHIPNDAVCDDLDACTTGDVCSGGVCAGTAAEDCDDGNACTHDSCDPFAGCVHTPNSGPCNNGNACSKDDYCLDGSCIFGGLVSCDDGDPCTDDGCSSSTGCWHVFNSSPCTTSSDTCPLGTCTAGACVPVSGMYCEVWLGLDPCYDSFDGLCDSSGSCYLSSGTTCASCPQLCVYCSEAELCYDYGAY